MSVPILPDLKSVNPTNPHERAKIAAHAERLLLRNADFVRAIDQFDKRFDAGSTTIMYMMNVVDYTNNPRSGEEIAAELHDAFIEGPLAVFPGQKQFLRTLIKVDEQAGKLLFSSLMVPLCTKKRNSSAS